MVKKTYFNEKELLVGNSSRDFGEVPDFAVSAAEAGRTQALVAPLLLVDAGGAHLARPPQARFEAILAKLAEIAVDAFAHAHVLFCRALATCNQSVKA